MGTITQHHNNDLQWTASGVLLSFLAGVLVVGALWLFAGLLMMLFLM